MSDTFKNHSRRLWTEDECRSMLNAALLYLAHQNGGRLDLDTAEILKAVDEMGHVCMAMSDDDKTLIITGRKEF